MRIATVFVALTLAMTATAAQAREVILTLTCDLNGAPGHMRMGVTYHQSFDTSRDFRGDISGVFPVGVTVYTYGDVTSATAKYTFRGQNQFADFVTAGSLERFRVQWALDQQRNGIWMIVNPFRDAQRHFCTLKDARRS